MSEISPLTIIKHFSNKEDNFNFKSNGIIKKINLQTSGKNKNSEGFAIY